MELNLLEKTELWIENIKLSNANLTCIAEVVGQVLNLPNDKVLVVDVRDNHITLDILKKDINAEDFFGKKNELINAIGMLPGVSVSNETDIHSDGILGMISLDESMVDEVIANTESIKNRIENNVKKRAIVFPTGFEVKKKMIEDTNTPYIANRLRDVGYSVKSGDVIDDDIDLLTGVLRKAVNDGYGLIITTGGIGAEDKDKTVEAIEKIDPESASSYIVKFEKGKGRHKKDGVRIGVGECGQTLMVALPGPNDEVRIGLEILISALRNNFSKQELADKLANSLKHKLMNKHFHHAQKGGGK